MKIKNWAVCNLSIILGIFWFICWFCCGVIILLAISQRYPEVTAILLAACGFIWLVIFFLVRELLSGVISIVKRISDNKVNSYLPKFQINFEVIRPHSIGRRINVERSINE